VKSALEILNTCAVYEMHTTVVWYLIFLATSSSPINYPLSIINNSNCSKESCTFLEKNLFSFYFAFSGAL